jgi:hypothetical protein
MDKIARLDQSERSELFRETAAQMGISEAIVEKDFWVCWTLRYLFNESNLSHDLIFKGGTCLSKVFGLIERFSEDIDLILNWELLGIGKDEPWIDRSKTKQDKYNKEVNKKAQAFIADTFIGMMKSDLDGFAIDSFNAEIDSDDPFVVNVTYPKAFVNSYIRPAVRLEIGPLASWVPHQKRTIKPYAAEQLPDVFDNPLCRVIAIKAERNFWEKATILHQEAHRSAERMTPLRYSRHYYDLYKMALKPIKDSALADFGLLKNVANFKMKFYPCTWAKYATAKPGTIRLVPDEEKIKRLQNDYSAMREMIFGEVPEFHEIIGTLAELEQEINSKEK